MKFYANKENNSVKHISSIKEYLSIYPSQKITFISKSLYRTITGVLIFLALFNLCFSFGLYLSDYHDLSLLPFCLGLLYLGGSIYIQRRGLLNIYVAKQGLLFESKSGVKFFAFAEYDISFESRKSPTRPVENYIYYIRIINKISGKSRIRTLDIDKFQLIRSIMQNNLLDQNNCRDKYIKQLIIILKGIAQQKNH